jgi:hypothetical protein
MAGKYRIPCKLNPLSVLIRNSMTNKKTPNPTPKKHPKPAINPMPKGTKFLILKNFINK